jgi:hypothetical protein
MGREDLRTIVETPAFQRALKRYPKDSTEGRVLKGLERLALGTTKKDERARRAHTDMASVRTLRQSKKELTGNGDVQHVSL